MKITIKLLLLISLLSLTNQINAQLVATEEGFDDIENLNGWIMDNQSNPLGESVWFQGALNSIAIRAQQGENTNSFIAANHRNTTAVNDEQLKTICNYLIVPDLGNLSTFSFYTRSVRAANNFNIYPDRLYLVYSPTGDINTGNCTDGFGDFTQTFQEINPNLTKETEYPEGYPLLNWQQFTTQVNGDGRLAFVYYVEDAGFYGTNSNYIGIDTVDWSLAPIVEGNIFSAGFEN